MARIPDAEMEARKRLLLRYLIEQSCPVQDDVRVSLTTMMVELELTSSQLRIALLHLKAAGYVQVERCFATNGAQVENAYRVTRLGRVYSNA